jgi:hypothetical protein
VVGKADKIMLSKNPVNHYYLVLGVPVNTGLPVYRFTGLPVYRFTGLPFRPYFSTQTVTTFGVKCLPFETKWCNSLGALPFDGTFIKYNLLLIFYQQY